MIVTSSYYVGICGIFGGVLILIFIVCTIYCGAAGVFIIFFLAMVYWIGEKLLGSREV